MKQTCSSTKRKDIENKIAFYNPELKGKTLCQQTEGTLKGALTGMECRIKPPSYLPSLSYYIYYVNIKREGEIFYGNLRVIDI